jgi:hypothetical protein
MRKRVTKEQLIEALSRIPDGYIVEVNTVGNLMITNPKGCYMGFVDFLTNKTEDKLNVDLEIT